MTRSLRFSLWLTAIWLSLQLCVVMGLIPGWGKWYSATTPYRQQTDAMLMGRIALSPSPMAVEYNMAWAEGGVQQVWGLGVPCWRLPFELLAKLCRQSAFPDRLAFAAALAIVSYLVLRVVSAQSPIRNVGQWLDQLIENPGRVVAIVVLLLFPPIMTVCRGRFTVYEEPVVYGYYYAIGLLAGTMAFARRPTLRLYMILSLLAGLVGFVRPTLLAYGGATVLVTWYCTRRAGWKFRMSMLGPLSFGLAGALLFWSNVDRFGSGFEFGHRLNINTVDSMLFSRFGAPFDDEPFWPAAKELLGSVFFVNEFSIPVDPYSEGNVPGQSATLRFRYFRYSTFDVSFLFGVIACWAWAAWRVTRSRLPPEAVERRELVIPAVWSFIGFVPMASFYLNHGYMSARYVLDFAPAVSAAALGCILGIGQWRPADTNLRVVRAMLLVLLGGWWGYEIVFAKQLYRPSPVFSQAEILDAMQRPIPGLKALPRHYDLEAHPSRLTRIPTNGFGWMRPTGEAQYVVTLFVRDPGKLRIEVAPADGESPTNDNYAAIRAKVGLEFLELESAKPTEQGRALTFSSPKRPAYQKGIQVVFLSFPPLLDLRDRRTAFRLIRVEWESAENSEA